MGIADNTPQKGYCVYAHKNKTNGKIYIGISKDVGKRWAGKIHAYRHSTLFYNALKKYGWDGFDHIVLWDDMSLEEACKYEEAMIFLFKFSGISYNITAGGEGHLGVPLTEEQKEKLRNIHKGKHFSEEHRKRLSEAQKKSSHRRKKVYAFNELTGELIKEYDSIAEASRNLNLSDSNISEAAAGINRTSGGYVWGYSPNVDKTRLKHPIERKTRRKKIFCYDLNGNFIGEYECAYDAADKVQGNYKAIHSCCAKKRITYKGYIWRYSICEIESEILKRIKKK